MSKHEDDVRDLLNQAAEITELFSTLLAENIAFKDTFGDIVPTPDHLRQARERIKPMIDKMMEDAKPLLDIEHYGNTDPDKQN